jgi:hypothetical protein
MTQFAYVPSPYGAPMGRPEYGIAENCEPGSITYGCRLGKHVHSKRK